jgi:Uma2 family endonuclease
MGEPARKIERATYADVLAAPPHRVAELIEGTLYTFPRPAPKHGWAASNLGAELSGPFGRGRGGPGGWRILLEPEIHFPDPSAKNGIHAVVPDLAGWRRERMPKLPRTKYFSLAPDWICEVLSPSTEGHDRTVKVPLYAREGVPHAWLVDPIVRTLEVYQLTSERQWLLLGAYRDDAVVRAPPFDAIDLELFALWDEAEGDEAADEA